MEEKRNFDKENNNASPKQLQTQQDKSKTTIENDQYKKSKCEPPPLYQANDTKKHTNEVAVINTSQWSEPYSLQHVGRPATLLIVPKFYEDKQNNNDLQNQSHTFRDTLLLNTKHRRTTDQEYGCLYSADSAQFNTKRNHDNNKNNYFSYSRDKIKEKKEIINQSIDTLNTAYTYHGTSCTSESMVTIGGVTLNQGSHSFDLESNFSRMVLGSQGTSSTLSAINGRRSKKRDLLNFAHFINSPRSEGQQQPIRRAHNIWFETSPVQNVKAAPAKKLDVNKQKIKKAEKKEKKKRLGPPPQVRNQASRQMDDPLANRPRSHTTDKSKKEMKKNMFPVNPATANEKY